MKVVITGASGFIGRELVDLLATSNDDWSITTLVRKPQPYLPAHVNEVVVTDLTQSACEPLIKTAFDGADTVVHLAAATPAKSGRQTVDLVSLNSELTSRLTAIAAAGGVRRFVYLSSALVYGATSSYVLNEVSHTSPRDGYAASKLKGELGLRTAVAKSAMEWTIVRPPLVYGPGVHGALSKLVKAVVSGVPLPLGSIVSNRRDMISLRNLCSFVAHVLGHPAAANELFVVRDGTPVHTRALIEAIAAAAGRRARLVPVSPTLLDWIAGLIGAGETVDRLTGDFAIDDSKARRLLGWSAPQPMMFDIGRMVAVSKYGKTS